MIRDLIGLIACLIAFFGFLRLLVKRIKEFIKIKPDDMDIKATVVHLIPLNASKVQPVLQYNVNGVVKFYKYHSSCPPEKYATGDEVTLKLSQESGLAYDRGDLKKELLLLLVIEVLVLCGGVFLACDFFLEV